MTHELAEWKDEIAWMSLYFSIAVWASLALCVFCSLEHYLPRYLTQLGAHKLVYAPAVLANRPAVEKPPTASLAKQRQELARAGQQIACS